MKEVFSFGIIPLRQSASGYQLFLIQHLKGKHWGFPKGGPSLQESPQESAARELREETGLTVKRFWPLPPLKEEYCFRRGSEKIRKCVTYFFADVEGEVSLQPEEILEGAWMGLDEAYKRATFKKILKQVNTIVGKA